LWALWAAFSSASICCAMPLPRSSRYFLSAPVLTEQMGELPEHFQLEHSSMDCYDCTAYRKHSKDRVKWTQERHPALYADYEAKSNLLNGAILEALNG